MICPLVLPVLALVVTLRAELFADVVDSLRAATENE